MSVQKELNAVAAVKYVIESELSDYLSPLFVEVTDIEDYNNDIYIDVSVGERGKVMQYMKFKIEDVSGSPTFDPDDDLFKIFVELSEDNYEQVETYTSRIKYLWIAFLDWPKPWTEKK